MQLLEMGANMRVAVITLGAIATMATSAWGYEIGSGSKIKTTFDVHETLTLLAMECRAAQTGPTFDCRAYADRIAAVTQPRNRIHEEKGNKNALPYTVRWPDDPTRMLDQDSSKVLFGIKMASECADEVSGDARINEAGLACSSHYGRLSFFHAMQVPQGEQPRDELELQGENIRTRNLALQWANFAFDAATDNDFRNREYCDAIKTAGPELQAELTFSNDAWCAERRGRKQWKVRTLFALHCTSWIDSNSCWERINDFGEEAVVAAAEGAILHLIQDSYSQAHAWRPTMEGWPAREKGPFAPIIACTAPKQFYRYTEQEPLMHNSADRPPQLDGSCYQANPAADDAITASATALYYLDTKDKAGFARYMSTRVFAS